jgi:hypothetical protein
LSFVLSAVTVHSLLCVRDDVLMSAGLDLDASILATPPSRQHILRRLSVRICYSDCSADLRFHF